MRALANKAEAWILADGQSGASGEVGPVPWWSFTKTVLAVTLLRLAELGKIDLDCPVAGKPFTPAHLLRHEAGVPDYGGLRAYNDDVASGRTPWTIERVMDAAGADRLLFEPGRDWAYSNIGYHLVARLIEHASDKPLADAIAELVFSPAGLASARLVRSREDIAGVNMGDAPGYDPGWVYHGLIAATAFDAARLLDRLLAGKLLAPLTLRRMLDPTPLPKHRNARHPDPAYGLGLMMWATRPEHHPIGHSGSGPGSSIAVYGQRGSTRVVWSASSSNVDPEEEVFRAFGHDEA